MNDDTFDWDGRTVTTYRAPYTVERLGDVARIEHRPSRLIAMADPRTGACHHTQFQVPEALIAEIKRRWGGGVR
jgi:hypothetical protein